MTEVTLTFKNIWEHIQKRPLYKWIALLVVWEEKVFLPYTLWKAASCWLFLRDANTSVSVIEIINLLDEVLGAKTFNSLFPVILTDNGSEFSNPKEIEKRSTITCNRTKILYCDPSAPYQKGACEVNHELIRRILPKGSSFDELTQQDITLMMNHINSYKRKKLNNRSPYETFSFYYGEEVLKKLGCSPVAAGNIILKPKLLKK